MRSALFFLFSLTVFFAPLSYSTLAQAESALSDSDIKKWGKAYQDIMAWAEKTDFKDKPIVSKEGRDQADFSRMYSQMLDKSKASEFYGDISSILKKNGYGDPTVWASQGDRIMMAYLANEMDKNDIDYQKQLKEAESMMQNLPPEQRKMMEDMLKQSQQAMTQASKAPQGDKSAVERNRGYLNSLFGM